MVEAVDGGALGAAVAAVVSATAVAEDTAAVVAVVSAAAVEAEAGV